MKFEIGNKIVHRTGHHRGVILGRNEGEGKYHVHWEDRNDDAIQSQWFIEGEYTQVI